MKYINIHTHNETSKENRIEIINYFPQQEIENHQFGSIGLHPWFINNMQNNGWIEDIKEKLNKKNVIAIGETGLDRITKVDLQLQEKIFKIQIEIAQEREVPVFIHCVKAYSDILKYKKQLKNSTPWIIHDFSENLQIARELIKHGCYLSFGKKILDKRKKIKTYLAELPKEKIFFETDDDLEFNIEEIYAHASKILNMSIDDLKQQIYFNFEKIFPGILENERLAATN